MSKGRSKKILKITLIILLSVLLLGVLLFTFVDRTPYREMTYYKQTKENVKTMPVHGTHADGLMAGWGKANISLTEGVRSIGHSKFGEVESIHDSVYVRSMVFKKGDKRIAIISYDLIIVHPILKSAVEEALSDQIDFFYFSCTHTHNSYGGWAPGIAGYFALGGYDQKVVDFLVSQTKSSVSLAKKSMEPASVSYKEINLKNLVGHRIDDDQEHVDSLFRVVKIEKASGKQGLLTTFAAHATSLGRQDHKLSGDYPGYLNRFLEANEKIDFTMYCAGGVASHKPMLTRLTYDETQRYSEYMASRLIDDTTDFDRIEVDNIAYASLDVELREPHMRVSQEIRVRPWVFNAVMGDTHPKLTCLKIGELTFVGTPADFSGELYPEIRSRLKNEQHLILTSFNGGYIGYITHDRHYGKDSHEVIQMNWYGPYNGEYFSELIGAMVNRVDQKLR